MEERGWRSGACGTPSLPAIKKPGLALFFYWLTGSGDGPLINLPLQPGDYFVRFKIMRFGEQSDAAERAPGFTANDADTFGDGRGAYDGLRRRVSWFRAAVAQESEAVAQAS